MLGHRIGIFVIGGVGEVGDGFAIALHAIIGETHGKPVVTIQLHLAIILQFGKIVSRLLILVEIVVRQSQAACHLRLVFVFRFADFWRYLKHLLVLFILKIDLGQKIRHLILKLRFVFESEEVFKRFIILLVLVSHISEVIDAAVAIGTFLIPRFAEHHLGIVIVLRHEVGIPFFEMVLLHILGLNFRLVDFIELGNSLFIVLTGEVKPAQIVVCLGHRRMHGVTVDECLQQITGILIVKFGRTHALIEERIRLQVVLLVLSALIDMPKILLR